MEDIKNISNQKEFIDLLKVNPNSHIQSILSLPRKGMGVYLKNLNFSFVPNPIIKNLRKALITNEAISLLKQFVFKDDEKKELSFINFINCSFDNSYILFGKEPVNLVFSGCQFENLLIIPKTNYSIEFINESKFNNVVKFESTENNLIFSDCTFNHSVSAKDVRFKNKVRFRNCEFHENVNFRNTTFDELADFWRCKFIKPVTFYKTDFNATTVFSAATFCKNVLFTYSLFGGKAIFGRTKFKEGFDVSQSIIAGELQLFDLNFNFKNYTSEYVGNDDHKYRKLVEEKHKIPLINKVTTFQILKNQFAKQGNHIDEITMRQQEKKAFLELTKEREKDKNWTESTRGDRFILWLNRWSNNYRSDFRNGISFTIIVATAFLLLTFITTGEFWSRICLSCEFDFNVIGYSIKQFVNFLNPTHNINYIDSLNPVLGIPYIFDFLGRIAVGYGYYQTVQAFRKFR